jgi:hypothetical protein
VTCLKVTGNTATFGFTQDSNPIFGPFGRVTVVDNDPQGTDTIAGETTSIPGDCSTPTTTLQQFVGSGDIVVHDAPALPTSKDQCRSGGWRNFPGFRNQGECVAFVERHPQP